VRAAARAKGPARRLLDTIEQSGCVLVLSPFLCEEVGRVLRYPRIQALYPMTEAEIDSYIERLASFAEIAAPMEGPPVVLKDPDDDPVVYTALAGGADAICTMDKHFYEPGVLSFCARYRIQVMSELELLRQLGPGGD
jgi:putative PIN family toxin of toxin-antitoxin system